jgi:urease accessory protein
MNKTALLNPVPLIAAALLLPSHAYAHAGGTDAGGFMHGLMHPVSGLDHICAMVAIGLWAAQMRGRALWVVPLAFVSVMLLGGVMPMLGIELPFVEHGIVFSVLALGVLVAATIRPPLWLSIGMTGLFALWHGYAHGAEMPALASGMGYAFGFMLATASMHIAGIFFGLGLQRMARERWFHVAGAGIALFGVYLAAI